MPASQTESEEGVDPFIVSCVAGRSSSCCSSAAKLAHADLPCPRSGHPARSPEQPVRPGRRARPDAAQERAHPELVRGEARDVQLLQAGCVPSASPPLRPRPSPPVPPPPLPPRAAASPESSSCLSGPDRPAPLPWLSAATEGDVSGSRPGIFELLARSKWCAPPARLSSCRARRSTADSPPPSHLAGTPGSRARACRGTRRWRPTSTSC